MADLEESFQLLSTMSPRFTNKNVPAKKVTKLALKKQIRRSSIYSKQPPVEKVILLSESESTETVTSSEYSYNVKSEPIVISDSSSDDDVKNRNSNISPLSTFQYDAISQWVTKVNVEQTKRYDSTFNDVPDISTQKLEATNLVIDTPVLIEKDCFKFNEALSELDVDGEEKVCRNKSDESVEDKSLLTRIKNKNNLEDKSSGINFITMRKKDKCDNLQKIIDDSSVCNNVRNGVNKNIDECNDVIIDTTPKNDQEHYENVLDKLYGNSWRINREKVLSNPESERHKKVKQTMIRASKTELKHTNPYLESEQKKTATLLRTLQSARLKQMMESPMMKSLKNVCDSDTDSASTDADDHDVSRCRTKLKFDESDSEPENLRKDKTVNKKMTKKKSTRQNKSSKSGARRGGSPGNSDENFSDLSDESDEKVTTKSYKDDKLLKTDSARKTRQIKYVVSTSSSFSDSSSSNGKIDSRLKNVCHASDKKINDGSASLLASLSLSVPVNKCDPSAKLFRDCFKTYKVELATKLFRLYNEKIFGNAIPLDTPLEWNDRMRGTAGFCYCKKITHRSGAIDRAVRIVLATKVLDCAVRLRDTLVHEMCHAATWIVNEVGDGHGQFWKSWARKAMETFPELPKIKRCHDYVINTKFTYKCTSCGYSIGRHSKSLDMERKRCGYCYGTFELLINKKTKNGLQAVPVTPKKEATGFALFVKQNYASVKTPAHSHADVMKALSKKFSEAKVSTN